MESLAALASFIFVASITPGPNNLMLAASGVGFGFRRTLPHMLGVCAGFVVLVLVCGAGIGTLLMQLPAAALALKVAGSAYLIVLAWRLCAHPATGARAATASGRPMGFGAAAAFQFANPKAWLMSVTAASAFLPALGEGWQALALLCLVASLVNIPCITSWAMLGSTIRRRLDDALWQRRFSIVMIVLTLYAALSIWL